MVVPKAAQRATWMNKTCEGSQYFLMDTLSSGQDGFIPISGQRVCLNDVERQMANSGPQPAGHATPPWSLDQCIGGFALITRYSKSSAALRFGGRWAASMAARSSAVSDRSPAPAFSRTWATSAAFGIEITLPERNPQAMATCAGVAPWRFATACRA